MSSFFTLENSLNKSEESGKRQQEKLGLKRHNRKTELSLTPLVAHKVSQFSGHPLNPETRSFMDSIFGYDFDKVRIHSNDYAAELAQTLNARAFTLGEHIVFGERQYDPKTANGQALLMHELTHVVEQAKSASYSIARMPDKEETPAKQEKDDVFLEIEFFLLNPALAEGALRTVLEELNATYKTCVKLEEVEFQKITETTTENVFGYPEKARAHWKDAVPVIELSDEAIAEFKRYNEDPKTNLKEIYSFIQTIGHEMYHLYRAKLNHPGNPLQKPFEEEYGRRLDQVRQNWLKDLQQKRPGLGKWTDISIKERTKIEEEAAETGFLRGLYYRSAYLVEEILTQIEELSFLRIEQKLETRIEKKVTSEKATEIARTVERLWNNLKSQSEAGEITFLTPEILTKTIQQMEIYLQNRYGKGEKAPYELEFFRRAIKYGQPPIVK